MTESEAVAEIVAWLILAPVFGLVTGTVALACGRRFWLWSLVGAVGLMFGLVALVFVALIGDVTRRVRKRSRERASRLDGVSVDVSRESVRESAPRGVGGRSRERAIRRDE